MQRVLIIGSGPASAGAALALTAAGVRPTIVDIGLRLEPELAAAVSRMADTTPATWSAEDRRAVTRQPIESLVDGLPEKRAFGSDFPFRDLGQLSGITAQGGSHRSVVSPAFGGFSNVWGAQITTFSPATFDDWPVSFDEMAPHYAGILRELPYAAADDDLSVHFPLVEQPAPLPPLAERGQRTMAAYGRHRQVLRRRGVVVGQARLAMDAPRCVRCGLCMTGCPYGLIYSASHTLDRLKAEGKIDHRPGMQAIRLEQRGGPPVATFLDQRTGETETIEADKVIVACGAMGTTRLVAGSLGLFDRPIRAAESAQFTLPMLSRHATDDPRETHDFTLNQFNMVIEAGPAARDLSQIHFYTYNPAFLDALPAVLRRSSMGGTTAQVLRRLSVAIGYLPSWASPALTLRFTPAGPNALPAMEVARQDPRWPSNAMLRRVLGTMVRVAPRLDLWPVVPRILMAAGGKTYHFGATFPHGAPTGDGRLGTDRTGRVPQWPDIHLVDASAFPSVPATTFTLTIMANAHRIASELTGCAS